MANDPIHRLQLLTRRAGNALKGPSEDSTRIDGLDDAARVRYYEDAFARFGIWAARVEGHTGQSLDGRRALDYGCGIGRTSLPLAERCEHVYGLDVSAAVLREADRHAKRLEITNVEWLDAGRLAELAGSYDLVLSQYVFQHIPSREGERIFAMLVRGLRPGGIGAIHVSLRPRSPLLGLARWTVGSARSEENPAGFVRGMDWSYPYMVMHSYSLNRLGRILIDAGITGWHIRWELREGAGRTFETATIFFVKD